MADRRFAAIPERFKWQRPWQPCWMTGTIKLITILLLMVIQHGDDVVVANDLYHYSIPEFSSSEQTNPGNHRFLQQSSNALTWTLTICKQLRISFNFLFPKLVRKRANNANCQFECCPKLFSRRWNRHLGN